MLGKTKAPEFVNNTLGFKNPLSREIGTTLILHPKSVYRLVRSDLRRIYGRNWGPATIVRALLNPSFRAAVLIRLALSGGAASHAIGRNLLITLHSIDIGRGAEVGEGIYLPHPQCIVIGEGARVGNEATIYHGVTLGRLKDKYPIIDDGVTIYPNVLIVGSARISAGSRVAPGSIVRPNEVPL